MEWKMEWNGTEISVWNMEDARMEWNGRFQEWNGRPSSILPCQFHRLLDFVHCIYRKMQVLMSDSDKEYCHRSI